MSRRLKPMVSEIIGEDKFNFLHNKQIHDAVAIAQEVLHSVKKINLKAAILKLDLPAFSTNTNGNEFKNSQLDNGMYPKFLLRHTHQWSPIIFFQSL
jgi:hypothetical protein